MNRSIAFTGSLETVELLIARGADLDKPSNPAHGPAATAVIVASENGHAAIVTALANAGADLNYKVSTPAGSFLW